MGKYAKLFETVSIANAEGANGLIAPHLDYIKEKGKVNSQNGSGEFTCSFNASGNAENVKPVIPTNEIWYTSTDGSVVTGWADACKGVSGSSLTIVSNTYVNGKGVVKMSGNIVSIEGYMGMGCETYLSLNLQTISLPNSVTSIGEYVFYNCSSLIGITIPNSVTSIGNGAFGYCNSLTGITIPNSVTSIGNYAFEDCESLTGITIPNSVTSIGESAFFYCGKLCSFNGTHTGISPDNRTISIDGELKGFAPSGLTSYSIPNSVTSIGARVFQDYSSLTTITIPNSVTNIEWCAFGDCYGLTGITIPNSVTSIGEYAFNRCDFARTNFINNSTCTSSNNWGATLYDSETSDGLLISGTTASKCRPWATNVTIPNSVTSIGYHVFYYCSSLTSVTIGNSVTSIGNKAFEGCRSLTGITIPNSVTSIGNYAFEDCSSLIEVICNPTTPPTLGSGAFEDNASDRKIKVPAGSVDAYKAATNWSAYASDIISQ